jgi:hypothetical protein
MPEKPRYLKQALRFQGFLLIKNDKKNEEIKSSIDVLKAF